MSHREQDNHKAVEKHGRPYVDSSQFVLNIWLGRWPEIAFVLNLALEHVTAYSNALFGYGVPEILSSNGALLSSSDLKIFVRNEEYPDILNTMVNWVKTLKRWFKQAVKLRSDLYFHWTWEEYHWKMVSCQQKLGLTECPGTPNLVHITVEGTMGLKHTTNC